MDDQDQVRPGRSVFADDEDDTDFFFDDDQADAGGDLPHWTDPPTQRNAAVEPPDRGWSSFTESPRWRDEDDEDDDEFEFAFDDTPSRATGTGPAVDEFFEFDEHHDELRSRDFDEFAAAASGGADEEPAGAPTVVAVDSRRSAQPAAPSGRPGRGARREPAAAGGPGGAKRDDMPMRVATAAAMAVAAIIAFAVGPALTVAVAAVVLGLASGELFTAARKAGHQPAALLGIVASAAMPVAVYNRGFEAIPIVMTLTVVFSMLWFLFGAGTESALTNAAITVFGVAYVGGLGGYAGLLLSSRHGIGMLLAAVIPVIGYDVGGLLIGRAVGRSPLSSASPNKTVEGLLGGCLTAVLAAAIVIGAFHVAPFGKDPGSLGKALVLGLAIAVVAPLGDLCESMLKRDLGVKDMSSVLPGHGGLLDRFDGLLFALPATWYVAHLLLY